MNREIALGAPLSEHAKREVSDLVDPYVGAPFGVMFFAGFLAMVFGACMTSGPNPTVSSGGYFLFGWLGVSVISFLISACLYKVGGERKKQQIFEKNLLDYNMAQTFSNAILPRFVVERSDQFPLQENELEGDWRAFRVEHVASHSLRGDLAGRLNISLRSLFGGGGNQEVSLNLTQLSTPDLLDMSTIIFFQNDRNETLRVLVPSPRATKEMVTRIVEMYAGTIETGTHLNQALISFNADENSLLTPISHPMILDRLDAATQKPQVDRPPVKVIGNLVQDGVALATALVVDGAKSVFLPSGYLGQLSSAISLGLNQTRKQPNLLDVVR